MRIHAIVFVPLILTSCSSYMIAGNSTANSQLADGSLAGRVASELVPGLSAGSGPKALLFVSDFVDNTVKAFSQSDLRGDPVEVISNGISQPNGLFVDGAGSLYVTNDANNTVSVYPDGQSTPSTTYSDGISSPVNVAVSRDGTVYVVNNGPSGDFIGEYAPGSMSPTLKIQPAPNFAHAVAVDSGHAMYAAFFDLGGKGLVERFSEGSGTGKNLGLVGLSLPISIVLDKNKNIIINDLQLNEILIYPRSATTPSLTVELEKDDAVSGGCLDKGETHYFVAYNHRHHPGGIFVYSYPDLKRLGSFKPTVDPPDCATSPPARS